MKNEWTTEKPNVPGFYWFWVGDEYKRIVEITVDKRGAQVSRSGIEGTISPDDLSYFPAGTRWRGPLSSEE